MYTVFTVDTVFLFTANRLKTLLLDQLQITNVMEPVKYSMCFFCHIYTLSNTIVGLAEAVVVHEGL